MTMSVVSVFLYSTANVTTIEWYDGITCEDVCMKLCMGLGIKPATRFLFALRISDTNIFITGGEAMVCNGVQYEFRLRFQISQLSELKRMDYMAFSYFYYQFNCDLIENNIPELVYPKFKDQVTGLCVTNMYNEKLDNNVDIDYMKENYKKYVPEKYVKKHSFVIKKRIAESLDIIKHLQHESHHVKQTFLEAITTLAPNYLVESCTALAELDHKMAATVTLECAPFHAERPGFNMYCPETKLWKHISPIEDIYAIIVDADMVKFEMRSSPIGAGFQVQIQNSQELRSFVSCISGYYRLVVKWTVNLCRNLPSPSLQMLLDMQCHGPIGGECAYTKLKEAQHAGGSYIIRQCEDNFDTYYIDTITKQKLTKTQKLTYENSEWNLHLFECTTRFKTLPDLIKSAVTDQMKPLLPSEYDKFVTLLLCLPPKQITAKKALSQDRESEMRQRKAQIFCTDDFQRLIKTSQITNNGYINEMKAEWCLPKNMKLAVTLKILEKTDHLKDFIKVAEDWSALNSPELIKMYGFSLISRPFFVVESLKQGSLDAFLRTHENINVGCMIDAAYSLARALTYLREQGITHGRIRCSSLIVIRYIRPNLLIVRLGDPYSKTDCQNEKPWIPAQKQGSKAVTANLAGDLFAYATTLWEIFSRGSVPVLTNSKRYLLQPSDCPNDIYRMMKECWKPRPAKEFSPQNIFIRFVNAKQALNNSVDDFPNVSITSESDSSDEDDIEDIYIDNKEVQLVKHTIIYELPEGRRILYNEAKKIGEGNYGVVYRGQYEEKGTDRVTEVAIKMFRIPEGTSKQNVLDVTREIEIMKKLQHKNIVRIITNMDEPACIIMELVKHQSLDLYVSANAPTLTTKKLLQFSKDIASGMEYLASHQIVHRDLAARNVLLDKEYCVKVSDFGLAQKINDSGYYASINDRKVPIYWHAPETLQSRKYSLKSDVWSFGVTLFEIFSHGDPPNLDKNKTLTIIEQNDYLGRGKRLEKPKQCPDHIYDSLMMSCWHKTPIERPSFTMLIKMIHNFIEDA